MKGEFIEGKYCGEWLNFRDFSEDGEQLFEEGLIMGSCPPSSKDGK
jgi:hypothetical protein